MYHLITSLFTTSRLYHMNTANIILTDIYFKATSEYEHEEYI